jgi:hypothetical protein
MRWRDRGKGGEGKQHAVRGTEKRCLTGMVYAGIISLR